MEKKTAVFLGMIGVLLFSAVFVWKEVARSSSSEVIFFDVGQGDSAFISTSKGVQVLIDGGPDAKVLEKLGKALPFWDKSIDLVVLSHPAQDHVGGLIGVLEKYHVRHIVWNGIQKDTAVYGSWIAAVEKEQAQGAEVHIAHAPQRILLHEHGCMQYLDIVYPQESLEGQAYEDDNDTSLVVRFESCGKSFLFTGDLTSWGEKQILSYEGFVDADVLKAGHHGSKTSSSAEFVNKVSPEIAVISSGKNNSYGHPHEQTLATFQRFGINVLRTDLQGDITLYLNQ
ncbi:MAG: MBL fold metallo-hydrolase [Candidatus Wildermuthbacteria bacterium]|nr:MBL fold metallo-hydrolase [Candidatus Wildermuthbacteria bacterium]